LKYRNEARPTCQSQQPIKPLAHGYRLPARVRATAAGHAPEARVPPDTRSTPCSTLRCPRALVVFIHCRPWAIIEANTFSPPSEALLPASAPLLPLCFCATLRSYRRQASVNGRRKAGTFPKPSTTVNSCPEASRGHPPSASAAPRYGQRASDSEPVCHHLPELGTGAVLLSDPQAKLLDGLRRPAPPAYSRLSTPLWRLSPGESPTAPPPQFKCPSSRHPTRPAPSTGLTAGCRNRPVPPPPELHG
jgi:hypothetical protein